MLTLQQDFQFLGDITPPAIASPDSGTWRSKLVGGATVKAENGFMKLALATTAEAETATLYLGDQLAFSINDLMRLDIWAKLSTATLHPAISARFGLIAAHNATFASIAAWAGFAAYGENNIQCESYDGVNNVAVESGQQILTASKRFTIDFASGVRTVLPPPSVGGKANVLFDVDDARNNMQACNRTTRFDMSNYSGGLQLFAQIQKNESSSVVGTGVMANLYIERFRVTWKRSA